jgi:hypothetical protein
MSYVVMLDEYESDESTYTMFEIRLSMLDNYSSFHLETYKDILTLTIL